MKDSKSTLNLLPSESQSTLHEHENFSKSHRMIKSKEKNTDDYVFCRKPTFIVQYESSQISYQKSHISSKTTRLLRNLLILLWLVTLLTVFTNLSTSVRSTSPRIKILPGWDVNTTRHIPTYIKPDVNTTLIEPKNVCDADDQILLLIIVCSSPDNFEKRYVLNTRP